MLLLLPALLHGITRSRFRGCCSNRLQKDAVKGQ